MFNIPLVFFADIPGLMVVAESEAHAILREGVRARYIGFQVSVPVFTVIVRKCYGVAGGGVIDRRGLNFKIAWPSAHWGSLPVEGGVKAAYRREIESAPDPAAREKEIEEELRQLASPFRTAEAFAIEPDRPAGRYLLCSSSMHCSLAENAVVPKTNRRAAVKRRRER